LHEVGLSIDALGRIYLSNLVPNKVAIFDLGGRLICLFGHAGAGAEEFKEPSGMWIDSRDRIYIADTDNSRIQVFQPVPINNASAETAKDSGR
jgi:sugar lactone lactonase YvrE